MNLTMEHLWLHHLEQVAFLVVGYLFFRHVFGIERGAVTLHPGLRLVFLMVAVPIDTFTGLALAMSSHNPFPGLRRVHRGLGTVGAHRRAHRRGDHVDRRRRS